MKQQSRGGEKRREKMDYESADLGNWRPARFWIGLIVLGVVARLVISAVSLGTNDAAAWLRFGHEINADGLMKTYDKDSEFNHPPLPGYWAALAARIADDRVFQDALFTNIFKLAPILADCGGIYLLWRIWRRRAGGTAALAIAAAFSCSLDSILVSGYHCNTDPVYVGLCLLAIYLLQDRDRPFWSGFALGAAINIKLIPLLLIPGLLLSCRRWGQAVRMVLGMTLWVLPFVPAMILARHSFVENVVRYNSVLDKWGLNFFLLWGQAGYDPGAAASRWVNLYYFKIARALIVALILIWAVTARWRRRWDGYELAVVTFAMFLVLAPGFGVQYTVLVGLLLFAVRPALAIAYAWISGAFIAAAYFVFWTGTWPAFSQWRALLPLPAAVLGLLTWILLIAIAATILLNPRESDATGSGFPIIIKSPRELNRKF